MHQVLIDFSCTVFLGLLANVEIIQQSLKYVKLCSGATLLLSFPTLVHLNQLSVILLCSSLQLGNICIPITNGLTHFLIKFIFLMAPLSREKKSTSRVSPPHNLPLMYYRVFISCIRNSITQMYWFFNAHGYFWNEIIVWLFSVCLQCQIQGESLEVATPEEECQAKPNLLILTIPCFCNYQESTVHVSPPLCLLKHFNLQLENCISQMYT